MTKEQINKSSNQTIMPIVILTLAAIGLIFIFYSRANEPETQDIDLREGSVTLEGSTASDEMNFQSGAEGEFVPQNNDQGSQPPPTEPNNNQLDNNQPGESSMLNRTQMDQPQMVIDSSQKYTAVMKTNYGPITLELFAQDTPTTVNNFVYLSQAGFYDGLTFHRIISDFMIQGGCPLSNGTGGPGYKFADEDSSQPLVKGSLAMANSGPNTNGSQFFIVTADSTPWLDGKHTNFGQVIEGMEVVDQIANVQTGSNDMPTQPVTIESVSIQTN